MNEIEAYKNYLRSIINCKDTVCSVQRGYYNQNILIGYFLVKNGRKIDINEALAKLYGLKMHNSNGGPSVRIKLSPYLDTHKSMVERLSNDLYGHDTALESLVV
jgi:hypothetical protein